MLSKTKINFIISLQKKKVREEERLFVIEGDKMVKEFLAAGIRIRMLVAKPEFLKSLPPVKIQEIPEVVPAAYEDLKRVSTMKTPHNALALVEMPETGTDPSVTYNELTVVLDTVQDPGNFGTIIRAAAWFGIRNILCSPDCVDVFNPKVIQASMGAILHVNIFYTDLPAHLASAQQKDIKIYGAVMDGEPVYTCKLEPNGIVVLGNESKGISDGLLPFLTDRIMIPGAGGSGPGIDSLNVSMAASVIFSEFARSREVRGEL